MALKTPAFNDAKTYGFEWLRAMLEASLQEGVLNMSSNATDFKVTAAGAGGMRVDVAAGAILVKGDSGVPGAGLTQGLFLAINDALIANAVTLNAADGANPRIDQIVARIYDSSDLGSGADQVTLEVITGAPTSGATLDNRNGAAALGNDRVRLADILVPAGSAAVTAGNVRDRRPWARGFYGLIRRSNATYTTGASEALIDSTNLYPRAEFGSGNVLEVSLESDVFQNNGTGNQTFVTFQIDGAGTGEYVARPSQPVAGYNQVGNLRYVVQPSAGSHRFGFAWWHGAGVSTLGSGASSYVMFVIREILSGISNYNGLV